MRRLLATLAALTLLVGCDGAEPETPGTLIVEAFVRTGAPLDTLTLRRTQALGARGAGFAEGADVRLALDGGGEGARRVAYRELEEAPGRYVPEAASGSEPVPQAGTAFSLRAVWGDQVATAEGRLPPRVRIDTAIVRVPDAPVRTVLLDSLRRDSLDVPAEQGYIYPIEVDLVWTAPRQSAFDAGDPYWMQARLRPSATFSSGVIDFFLRPEAVFQERTAAGAGRQCRWSGVYAVPAASASAPLPAHRLRVGLVRSDSSYARFARTQRRPDQRAPDGNVRGALGIAAGIAIDRRTFAVGE